MDVVDWEVGSIDPSIKTCADLKGQTIGVDTVGGARYLALDGMLSKCKLSLSDVKTVNFPGAAAMQAMIAGSAEGLGAAHRRGGADQQAGATRTSTVQVKLT